MVLVFCNCHRGCLRAGVARALSISETEVEFVREGSRVPELRPGRLLAGSYVDNANLIGADKDTTDRALHGVLDEFSRRHLASHEVCDATTSFEACGVDFHFAEGRCRPKPARSYLAAGEIATIVPPTTSCIWWPECSGACPSLLS